MLGARYRREMTDDQGSVPSDRRYDEVGDHHVVVVASRQGRPNLPIDDCPFCIGGREAPDPYEVKVIDNRWPSMADGRCEVVLYTDDHEMSLGRLGRVGIRRVIDTWAERSEVLGARDDVEYVLIFENRGADVGATIHHPHGQIYAYDHVPKRVAQRLRFPWKPDAAPGDRLVLRSQGWSVVVPYAPTYPISLEISPDVRIPDLVSLSDVERDAFADVLGEVLRRLDAMYDCEIPYMMWVNQRPRVMEGYEDAWLHVEIVSPWRSKGVIRHIAAAEVAGGEYFLPVTPESVAQTLAEVGARR